MRAQRGVEGEVILSLGLLVERKMCVICERESIHWTIGFWLGGNFP